MFQPATMGKAASLKCGDQSKDNGAGHKKVVQRELSSVCGNVGVVKALKSQTFNFFVFCSATLFKIFVVFFKLVETKN